MSLPKGFKAEANRIAIRVRAELKARPEDPLDLERLAHRLEVLLIPLSTFRKSHPAAVRHLDVDDPSAFSAITLCFDGKQRILIHNDGHSPHRQRSNIAHEFSHVLLKHQMTVPFGIGGCRDVDLAAEEQANWLAAVLLIPDPAAIRIVYSRMNEQAACDTYGVSSEMLRFRLNTSGARIRAKRFQQGRPGAR